MRITLSDHFTYQKLLRFTMPSIVMMIITSVYSIVDGFFVSNCVGKNAFAALNLIFPVLMALSAFGFMVGTGGSALIAKTLGEGKTKEANGIFSMLVAILAVGGAVLAAVSFDEAAAARTVAAFARNAADGKDPTDGTEARLDDARGTLVGFSVFSAPLPVAQAGEPAAEDAALQEGQDDQE